MSTETSRVDVVEIALPAPSEEAHTTAPWPRLLTSAENFFLAVALTMMMAVPLAEMLLRRTLGTGIYGANAITQHLGLLVGMVGGAIAARERRLLALSTLDTSFLKGRVRSAARVFSAGFGATICVFLTVACQQFVSIEREAAGTVAYGVPTWMVELVMPIGFALIAFRLLYTLPEGWWGRAAALAVTGALVVLGTYSSPAHMLWPALIMLTLATIIGTPVFVTLGGVSAILFWAVDQPIASIPIAHYSLVTNPSLPTIPLFTLAGYFLAEGGAARRFIKVFHALFGNMSGGPAIVTVVVCAFFTSFTGASGVTILALGGLLMPILLAGSFREKDALGLLTASGSLGLLLPPCLPLILYAIVARIPIQQIFLGGIGPAIVLMIATAVWGVMKGRKTSEVKPLVWADVRSSVWEAKWELAVPFVALFALFSGIATPVEASALTALYCLLIETVIYRDLHPFRDLPRVVTECGLMVGGVLLILSVALGFTNYLVDVEVPAKAVAWTTTHVHSRIVFLLALNLFLLIVGCLMDIYSAIIVQVPLLVPIGLAYGIDPVHLGIIFLANLELGYLTPPVGLNLYLSSYRFGKTVPEVLRAVMPMIVVNSIGVLVITYVPWFTTALPKLFGQGQ
jgi:tripartite ATP-independent transporter DctM subunit